MWEIRENNPHKKKHTRLRFKHHEGSEEYECGYEDGYRDAMREAREYYEE
jgi:hypothetical protein